MLLTLPDTLGDPGIEPCWLTTSSIEGPIAGHGTARGAVWPKTSTFGLEICSHNGCCSMNGKMPTRALKQKLFDPSLGSNTGMPSRLVPPKCLGNSPNESW